MYDKYSNRTLIGLFIGIPATILTFIVVAGVLVAKPDNNAVVDNTTQNAPISTATATLITYVELHQPFTQCQGFDVESGKNVLTLDVNGRTYALDSQSFVEQTGQPIPQLSQTGTYKYYGRNPCKMVYNPATVATRQQAQINSDRKSALMGLAWLIPLVIIALILVFRTPKPKITKGLTYKGYRMRLKGKNEVSSPFSAVNISISENGDLMFADAQNET